MRELKEKPKDREYTIRIPCICKEHYDVTECKRFHKCPKCGHVYDLAPWLR